MRQEKKITTAVLLAAGAGTRLHGEAGAEPIPKCLIEVGGMSILERLLDNLRANGIRRLVIVTGYMEDRIREAGSRIAKNIQVEYIENTDFAITNNIYSLWLAKDHIREAFLLIESDLVFETSLLRALLVPDKAAVSEMLPWMNGTTVELDGLQRVDSFYLTDVTSSRGRYKTVNIYSLSLGSWQKVISRLEQHVSSGRINSYYEIVLSELVAENDLGFEAVFFPTDRWYEIDTLSDKHAANELLRSWHNG